MSQKRIILQKGVNPPECYTKIEEVQVSFKCFGGPIGEVGTYSGETLFTLQFAKTIHSYCKDGMIVKEEKEWPFSQEDETQIIRAFSPYDFDPDVAYDLVVSGLDCNGEWTSTKTVCVYEVESAEAESAKSVEAVEAEVEPETPEHIESDPRENFDFYK